MCTTCGLKAIIHQTKFTLATQIIYIITVNFLANILLISDMFMFFNSIGRPHTIYGTFPLIRKR